MHYRKHTTSPRLFWHTALLTLVFGLIITYVWQINNQTEQSFAIQELEKDQKRLEDSIRDLTWDVSSARSLASMTQRALELELEPPKDISFIEIGHAEVAVLDD